MVGFKVSYKMNDFNFIEVVVKKSKAGALLSFSLMQLGISGGDRQRHVHDHGLILLAKHHEFQ